MFSAVERNFHTHAFLVHGYSPLYVAAKHISGHTMRYFHRELDGEFLVEGLFGRYMDNCMNL
jgi:hypothetical protein